MIFQFYLKANRYVNTLRSNVLLGRVDQDMILIKLRTLDVDPGKCALLQRLMATLLLEGPIK